VAESQGPGVQGLAFHGADSGAGGLRQVGHAPAMLAAIERVADHRVAALGQMDPDLVGAAGQEPAFQQARRAAGQDSLDLVTRYQVQRILAGGASEPPFSCDCAGCARCFRRFRP